MNNQIASKPDPGDAIAEQAGKPVRATGRLQGFFNDIEQKFNKFLLGSSGVRVPTYLKTELPPVPDATNPSIIYVSNEAGGAVLAFSDGTNWRRSTDRAIVS